MGLGLREEDAVVVRVGVCDVLCVCEDEPVGLRVADCERDPVGLAVDVEDLDCVEDAVLVALADCV